MSNKHDLPARLRMACDTIRRTSMPIKYLVPMMHEAADAIQRLEAENEALKKDAERLNFLDERNRPFRMGWEVAHAPIGNVSVKSVIFRDRFPTSIRTAIDAAMTKEQKT
jgi:hypothetical protein